MNKGIISISLMIVAAVLVSGCIFGEGPLDQVPPHIIAATGALVDLDLLEGKVNTFSLDDEIWTINQILSEIEEIPEDEPELAAQYQAYRTWSEALELMSQVYKGDYMVYQSHLRQAERLYDEFNYIGWRQEMLLAKEQAGKMARKAGDAADMMERIPREALPAEVQQSLLRSKDAMIKTARQGADMESSLQQKL